MSCDAYDESVAAALTDAVEVIDLTGDSEPPRAIVPKRTARNDADIYVAAKRRKEEEMSRSVVAATSKPCPVCKLDIEKISGW